LTLHRALARDREALTASLEAMIYIATIDNAGECVTGETAP
jgi:hypothetical protein